MYRGWRENWLVGSRSFEAIPFKGKIPACERERQFARGFALRRSTRVEATEPEATGSVRARSINCRPVVVVVVVNATLPCKCCFTRADRNDRKKSNFAKAYVRCTFGSRRVKITVSGSEYSSTHAPSSSLCRGSRIFLPFSFLWEETVREIIRNKFEINRLYYIRENRE